VKALNSKTNHVGINLAGDITALNGYAESSRQIANALHAVGLPFVINQIRPPYSMIREAIYRTVLHSGNDLSWINFVSKKNPHPVNLIRLNPILSQKFYATNPEYFRERNNIAMWAWEFTEFPEEWASCFQPFNEIWAISNYAREAIAKSSPVPVRTLTPPLQIDESCLNPFLARQQLGLKKETLLFLFAFTGATERKNPDAVIEAFRRAFSPADNVALIIKTTPLPYPSLLSMTYRGKLGFAKTFKSSVATFRDLRTITKASRKANAIILRDHLSRKEFLSLVSSCDCFVSLHRTEGFGQILAQAMYLGKPVIATGYSGNLDYMNHENSLLVKHRLVPIGRFAGSYGIGSEKYTWAEPDVEHASELMRWVYEHREEARTIGEKASKHVRDLMDPMRVGEKIREKCANLIDAHTIQPP
jgi:glycosyltransferase involved in cell wall biosynthesis